MKKPTTSGSKQKVKITDIDQSYGAIRRTNALLQGGLSRNIVFSHSEYAIAFHSLDLFNFRKRTYSFAVRASIEKVCLNILKRFGIYERGKIEPAFKKKTGDEDYNPIAHFVQHIVGFHRLPVSVRGELEGMVKSNLKELLALIDEYERDRYIIDYKEGNRRNEHESKIRVDFYERCIKERDTIVKYLANDLEKRAIAKASQNEHLREFGLLWYEGYWDRPYKWWQHRSIEFFDYRKVNVCRHRLDEITVRQIPKLEVLYQKDKGGFYRILFKAVAPEMVFHEFNNYYIPVLPKVAERRPVFDEMEYLFKKKKWYGYTALALTQVEGIFSDMLDILFPNRHYSSLSTKVFAVRPYYNFEERNFDYFEYHLPKLRNSFLHSGSIGGKDFRLISYDLLYDLRYLMSVFHELNDPHIELHKILKKRTTEVITGIASLNHLLNLVAEVQSRHKKHPEHVELKSVLDEWRVFEKEVLSPSQEMEYYLSMVYNELGQKLADFYNRLKLQTQYDGAIVIDLEHMNMKTIMGSKQLIIDEIKEFSYSYNEEYKYFMDIFTLTRIYKHHLPHSSEHVTFMITEIQNKYGQDLIKLQALKEVFKD